ncbi:AAA family ATPase [Litoreibacter janthinus]|uniref:AAA domain-containing protein n=1 Tax=Litoreibacter janthinus TaxID=670154 RepID=A0A1I6GL70_9RHOB|nr:AAA family ATPase [Litoreibacter janthinus]SFR42920.1 AAA domain-containing protein [Litoreibacter janthinus]
MTDDLTAQIKDLIVAQPAPHGRRLIAVAGPPAGGKSTLAEHLAEVLPNAAVVPMDGFHLDNDTLSARGLLARKGSPATFDALGFVKLVSALRDPVEVAYPTFDRSSDSVVPSGGSVSADTDTVIVEGNYLLLDDAPWNQLRQFWDLSIFLDVPFEVLRERLLQRWRDHGYSDSDALTKAESNDLPNARVVMDSAANAMHVVSFTG